MRLLITLMLFATTVGASSTNQSFTYHVLYTFAGEADGGVPVAGLVSDNTGNFYGTTEYRGTYDWGVVFKLDANGQESVLHSFAGAAGADGSTPRAGLILDEAGNLYGTAMQGGSGCGGFTCGVVFKIDSTGHESLLHSFNGTDGEGPEGGLLRDSAGNLYGTTQFGASGYGVVFKLDTTGEETVLYTFTGAADGAGPAGGVIADNAGNFYGTTQNGGDFSACPGDGCGVVFKLDPTTGMETVLYTFTGGADGRYPSGDLIQDSSGNLYGMTSAGGGCISYGLGCGVVFKVDPATGIETVLYTFTGGADGGQPSKATLFMDEAGILYGTTTAGGASGGCGGLGCGVIFELDPTTGMERVLYTFAGGADGGQPSAGLIRDSAGNFYGTAGTAGISGNCGIGCGVVFILSAGIEAPIITSVAPPGGTVGTLYSHVYAATGTVPINYSVTMGALPTGLTLSTSGHIDGTPTTAGTFEGTVTASNGILPDATQTFSIRIGAGDESPIITSAAPPGGKVGTPYTHDYAATGNAPINYEVTMGDLPTGLVLSGTGHINGTPTTAGTFEGTVTASNGILPDATQTFSIRVTGAGAGGGNGGGGGGGILEVLSLSVLLLLGRGVQRETA